MNLTWGEGDDKESNSDEEDRTNVNQINSFTVNPQSDANSLQLLPIGINSSNRDIAGQSNICLECSILKMNLESELRQFQF